MAQLPILALVDLPDCSLSRLHRDQRVHFLETLHALAGRVIGESLPNDEEFMIHDRLVQRLPKVGLRSIQ